MDGGTLDVLLTLNNASRGNINRNNLLAVHGGTMSIGGSLSPGNAKQAGHINNRIRIERASTRLTAASFKTQGDCALEYVVPAGGFGGAAPFTVSGTASRRFSVPFRAGSCILCAQIRGVRPGANPRDP